jgi:hypothetical protein
VSDGPFGRSSLGLLQRLRPEPVDVDDLRDAVDAVHERRELLELRPLVVRGRDRDVDLDRLFDFRHVLLLFVVARQRDADAGAR